MFDIAINPDTMTAYFVLNGVWFIPLCFVMLVRKLQAHLERADKPSSVALPKERRHPRSEAWALPSHTGGQWWKN